MLVFWLAHLCEYTAYTWCPFEPPQSKTVRMASAPLHIHFQLPLMACICRFGSTFIFHLASNGFIFEELVAGTGIGYQAQCVCDAIGVMLYSISCTVMSQRYLSHINDRVLC